jgi:hypothetical protein
MVIDIRVCSRSYAKTAANFTVSCQFSDGQDCSDYFYSFGDTSSLPLLDDGSRIPTCKIFIPPLDIRFQSNENIYGSELKDQMEIRLFKEDPTLSYYFTYYTSQHSPYRTIFGMNGNDSDMTLQDANNWIQTERDTSNLKNTFTSAVDNFAIVSFSLTETQALTNSSWNYFGFSNIYNTTLELAQNKGPESLITNSGNRSTLIPSYMLEVKPSEYTIRITKEQKVSTILGRLASADGVFSAIVAIQTILFGFRPDSPWGIVHRWSGGRQKETLRDALRDDFNTDNSPVPMVTRVRGDYHLLSVSSDSTIIDMDRRNEDEDNQNFAIKFRNMENRMQLMEDLFKTYYINDEVFQKLNEAKKDNSSNEAEMSETQVDEQMLINQTDQRRDSRLSTEI